MGQTLPGCPIVGYYNQDKQDFEGHERDLVIDEEGVRFVDITRPYGFVAPDAQVWFQQFEENGVTHEYLMTECYLWTGAYSEAQRIVDKGNNQSMELSEKNSLGFWAKDKNTNKKIFIFNETLIEKLCILGEDVEPCFEGAQFKTQFSLDTEFQEFKNTMFAMMQELQETLAKGGSCETMEDNQVITAPEEFEKKEDEQEVQTQPEDTEKEPAEKEEEQEQKKYNLEDVVEYAELTEKFNALTTSFEELQQEYAALKEAADQANEQLAGLKEFKLAADRKEKQAMIDSFYMLSAEDKADVVANIDVYSLDDIEAKLSIFCFRNKINFNLDTVEENQDEAPVTFSLESPVVNEQVPEWVQAVQETAKKL